MDESGFMIAGDISAEDHAYIRTKYDETVYVACRTAEITQSERRQGMTFCCWTSDGPNHELRNHMEHLEQDIHAVITRECFSVLPLAGEPENIPFEHISKVFLKQANGVTTVRIVVESDFWNANTDLHAFRVEHKTIALYLNDPREFEGYLREAKRGRFSTFSVQESGADSRFKEEAAYDAFLTHDWGKDLLGRDNHERVKIINELLKDNGVVTWFDNDRLRGHDMVNKIALGIDRSKKFVVFLTQRYVEKVNGKNPDDFCKREFLYGAKHKKVDKIVVVVMEESMLDTNSWSGQLDFIVGSTLYVDMTTDDKIRENIGTLVDEINAEV